jgi:alpha-L-fucosidase
MGDLVLEGYADTIKYAQLLHDASEVKMSARKETTWIREDGRVGDIVLKLPILKPDFEIPVVELILK